MLPYFGLDLTTSERRPSAYALLDDRGRLLEVRNLRTHCFLCHC